MQIVVYSVNVGINNRSVRYLILVIMSEKPHPNLISLCNIQREFELNIHSKYSELINKDTFDVNEMMKHSPI